mgnify:CR=1 FL=1
MLLILMYHKISESSEPDRLPAFREHLIDLKKRFAIVTPGDPTPSGKLAICLTFDDAYYDFYHHVYPLLKELDLKAVLAIPTAYIVENTEVNSDERLAVPYPDGLSTYASVQQHAPFCTWAELREMVNSKRVYPASHSHTHANLCDATTHLQAEISDAKALLEAQLHTPIDTFVYPYGRMNAAVHKAVREQHRFGLRIGAGLNMDWDAPKGLLYRVNADPLWMHRKKITTGFLLKSGFNCVINRLSVK